MELQQFAVLANISKDKLKEVSKDDFFDFIGPKNVEVSTRGCYPYTTVFMTHSNNTIGVISKASSYKKGLLDNTNNIYFLKA
jgi:hypothetical protein